MTTKDLISELAYQTTPGIHTYGRGECGHTTRGCRSMCAECIDTELTRRGVDATKDGKYEWIGWRIVRKGKR